MLNRFRASLEEADVIKDRNLALDFIGKRGSIENSGRVSQFVYPARKMDGAPKPIP